MVMLKPYLIVTALIIHYHLIKDKQATIRLRDVVLIRREIHLILKISLTEFEFIIVKF